MIVPMDRADLGVASLVRAWLRFYTSGAPAPLRERRAQQIESDLWEHQADAITRGAGGAALSLAITGRMVRGIPADIAWRTRIGGFAMNIKVPFNRMAGLLVLSLVILLPIASSINGYDTGREEWPSELARLGRMEQYQTTGNTIFQVVAGLALLGAAAAFGSLFASRSRTGGTMAAVFVAGAGVLTLVSSALYHAVATMARTFVDGEGDAALVTSSRAVALVMDNTALGATLCLVAGVFLLAGIAARERLVPRWLVLLPTGSLVAMLAFVALAGFDSDFSWGAIMIALLLLMAWLLVAGLLLLFGVTGRAQPAAAAAAA